MYAALFFLACTAQLFCCGAAKNISFADCGSKVGKIVGIDITPCDVEPCTFYKEENATCTITFIPYEEVTTRAAMLKVYGIISSVKVLWKSWKVCDLTKCPVEKNKETKIVLSLVVKKEYPSLKLVVEMEMKDQTEQTVFCGEYPAQIKNKGLREEYEEQRMGRSDDSEA